MKRIAFVSDIHSNQQALRAVLDSIAALGCTEIYCLGDLVGYGACPTECLHLLHDVGAGCLLGNHDALVSGQETGEEYNENSRIAGAYNRQILSDEHMDFLLALPKTIQYKPEVLFCHGSPTSYNQYTYFKIDFSLTVDKMSKMGLDLCFLGHTHHPVVYDGEVLQYSSTEEFLLPPGRRYIINPGSVGQPRDGDPRASFAVWNETAGTLRFHRVEYDLLAARADILAVGLPEHLGNRLLRGK
jgi:diadenosine tetraphosphatase ApaH/serine/threonine PP2A family protein phosphatase